MFKGSKLPIPIYIQIWNIYENLPVPDIKSSTSLSTAFLVTCFFTAFFLAAKANSCNAMVKNSVLAKYEGNDPLYLRLGSHTSHMSHKVIVNHNS